MSDFQRNAVRRIVEEATALGVMIPGEVKAIIDHAGSYAARAWADANPDSDLPPCCYGSIEGHDGCGCWVPVYDTEQLPPRPPERPEDIAVAAEMCGDCAFRKGSPERSTDWEQEFLFSLAAGGKPFWCHEGMRRPARWEHPDGRVIDGHPDDWHPPQIGSTAFRADGRPGLLCAGWMARAIRTQKSPSTKEFAQ